MKRTPEPEVMDGAEQARAYADADFSEPDTQFVAALQRAFGTWNQLPGPRVADLGCGPGNIALRMAAHLPDHDIVGYDGASAMLAIAGARAADRPNLRFEEALLPDPQLPRAGFELIVSNSLLHHLHDPHVLWRTILDIGSSGAAVFVGDLRRPADEATVDHLVQTYSSDEPAVLTRDFRASLHAAFTVDEIRDQLGEHGLGHFTVETPSDRHVYVWGRLS